MEINKIAVFGATGRTGMPFIKQAVEHYQVKALVRHPDKLSFRHDHLELIQGDVLNQDDVNKTIEGTQAVISLLGHGKGSPENLLIKATQHFIKAMHQYNIKRLISLTGGGVRDKENDASNSGK